MSAQWDATFLSSSQSFQRISLLQSWIHLRDERHLHLHNINDRVPSLHNIIERNLHLSIFIDSWILPLRRAKTHPPKIPRNISNPSCECVPKDVDRESNVFSLHLFPTKESFYPVICNRLTPNNLIHHWKSHLSSHAQDCLLKPWNSAQREYF